MGGKSRKSGKISKELINQIIKNNPKKGKGKFCGTTNKTRKDKPSDFGLYDDDAKQ